MSYQLDLQQCLNSVVYTSHTYSCCALRVPAPKLAHLRAGPLGWFGEHVRVVGPNWDSAGQEVTCEIDNIVVVGQSQGEGAVGCGIDGHQIVGTCTVDDYGRTDIQGQPVHVARCVVYSGVVLYIQRPWTRQRTARQLFYRTGLDKIGW